MIDVRPARPDEAAALLAIQRAASVGAFAHIFPPERYPFPDDAVRERWMRALLEPETDVVVAELRGELVGLVSSAPGWLRALDVIPEAQGRGIGSRLHDEALEGRRRAGDTVCRLWTLEEAEVARRFYERRGWRLEESTRVAPYPPYPIELRYAIDLRIRAC